MYLHGEGSLASSIVKLAQSFTCQCNLPLLCEEGAFGSRTQNGKDHASPRYIFTKLRPYIRALFPEVDEPVLGNKTEEGVKVEPAFYMPTIPLLCNGANGIA